MTLPSGRVRQRPVASHTTWPLVLAVVLALGMVAAVAVLVSSVIDPGEAGLSSGRGSGVAATESRDLPPFTGVDLVGSNTVTVRLGTPQSVVVRADDNLISTVTTTVESGTLRIGARDSFSTQHPMSVSVTVPSLRSVTLSGSGSITVHVSGRKLAVSVPGSGTVRASGRVVQVKATLGGSGNLELQDLVARQAAARIDGSGQIRVHATRSLVAAISGSGVIRYSGNPSSVTSNVTGSGSVTRE